MKSSFVDLQNAAYLPTETTEDWLGHLAEQFAHVVPSALGASAWLLSQTVDGVYEVDDMVQSRRLPGITVIAAIVEDLAERSLLHGVPGQTLSSLDDPRAEAHLKKLERNGIGDLAVVGAGDGAARKLYLIAALAEKRSLQPREQLSYRVAAAHLAAAVRLRTRPHVSRIDSFQEVHRRAEAADEAKALIGSDDRQAARDVWKQLIQGELMLAEVHDSGSRRLLVARKSEPEVREVAQLSRREAEVLALLAEGQSSKLVALALGVSQQTISSHTANLILKLGARSQAQIRRIANVLRQATGEPLMAHLSLTPLTEQGSSSDVAPVSGAMPTSRRRRAP